MDIIKDIEKLEKEKIENLISSLDNITEATQLENMKFFEKLRSNNPEFFQYMNDIHKDNSFLLHFLDFNLSIDNMRILNPIYKKNNMSYNSLDKNKVRRFVSDLYDESLENVDIYFFEEKHINISREAFTETCGKDNHVIFLPKNHPDLDNTLAHEYGHNIFEIVSRKNNHYYSHKFLHEVIAFFTQLKYIEKYGDRRDCLRLLHMLVQLHFAFILFNFPDLNFEEFYQLDELSKFKTLYKKNELQKYYNMFKENDYFYEYCYRFSSLILSVKLIDDVNIIKKLMVYDRDKNINELLLEMEFDMDNFNKEITDFIERFR